MLVVLKSRDLQSHFQPVPSTALQRLRVGAQPSPKSPLANRDLRAKSSRMPTSKTPRRSVKSEALRLVRGLPASSTWDDLMYRIYVRQKIDAGLSDIAAGRVHSHASIRKEFGVS